jgi:hypothetical protein
VRRFAGRRAPSSPPRLVALVVPASTEPDPNGVSAALFPVTLGYVAVQVACAAHVVLVRLRERVRGRGAQTGTTSTAAP